MRADQTGLACRSPGRDRPCAFAMASNARDRRHHGEGDYLESGPRSWTAATMIWTEAPVKQTTQTKESARNRRYTRGRTVWQKSHRSPVTIGYQPPANRDGEPRDFDEVAG